MATRLLGRRLLFSWHLVPVTLGVTSGALLLSKQTPYRLDALSPAPSSRGTSRAGPPPPPLADGLNDNTIKQLSGGSLAGFLSGLLVSIFSRTLVVLIGLSIVVVQVASRYGIDLARYLRLKERAQSSKILTSLSHNTPFKLSFGLTFAMAAFMQF